MSAFSDDLDKRSFFFPQLEARKIARLDFSHGDQEVRGLAYACLILKEMAAEMFSQLLLLEEDLLSQAGKERPRP